MNPIPENDTNYITFPETYSRRKLNTMYREIPLTDNAFRTLRKYFNAMANLYGIISLREAYKIICQQNSNPVTEEEFLAFAEIARHEIEDYYILGAEDVYFDAKPSPPMEREIVSTIYFAREDDPYIEIKNRQYGKSYYIPPKKELLRYADPFYIEETPELMALENFLATAFHLNDRQKSKLRISLLHVREQYDDPLKHIMADFELNDYTFENKESFEKFVKLYQEFNNASRLQCNRGYSPREVSQQKDEFFDPDAVTISLTPELRDAIENGKIDLKELRETIHNMDFPHEEIREQFLKEVTIASATAMRKQLLPKVGRNDLCPCGSGKKYKKCCGK